MKRLSAADAMFLYNETPRTPMHIAAVQIFDLPEGMDAEGFVRELRVSLASRLERVPYMTRKVVEVPFGLDHPVWGPDSDFDIQRHVRGEFLPSPGGQRELEAAVARLHATLMDRRHPLWEVVVLGDYAPGQVAIYHRTHHACIDGMASQAVQYLLMDTLESPSAVPPVPDTETLDEPDLAQLWLESWEHILASRWTRQLRAADAWMASLRAVRRSGDPVAALAGEHETAPSTRFNRPVSAGRSVAFGDFSLAACKGVARQYGATVNEVFLAVCSGALRTWLQELGELPEKSLYAGCPVSLRSQADTSLNNQVAMMRVSLSTDIHERKRRVEHIRLASANAKRQAAELAALGDSDWSEPGLPLLLRGAAVMGDAWAAAGLAPAAPVNVVISNVPGPGDVLYANGARMRTHYPVSIPNHGVGLNITVQSYAGNMYFGITACADALPDAAQLRDLMLDELKALRAPARRRRDSSPDGDHRSGIAA